MSDSIFTITQLKENYDLIIRLLSEVQADHVHMQKSLDLLEKMPPQAVAGDIAGQAKATSAMEIVKSREATNHKLIEAYMRIYEDLRTVIFSQSGAEENEDGEK
ncbi:MAG: hypothetical protein ACI4JN_09025 [Ruminococcus sp.]